MQFDSIAAALAMDGHGIYVWSVVVVSILVTAGLLLQPSLSARRFIDEQRSHLRREGAVEAPPERAAPTALIEEVKNAPGS